MKLKVFLFSFLTLALATALSLFAFAAATDVTSDVKLTFKNLNGAAITDKNIDTAASGKNVTLTVESDENLGGIWLRYSAAPVGGYLDGDKKLFENGFWSEYVPLGKSKAVLTFEEVTLCEINVYSEGELPAEVQVWEVAQNETDIMLFSAHSDDDQLFFAGLVPYYVSRGDVEVKVCFFTTSYQQISRVQELLAGLWHCGLKAYPIILPMPDDYSESLNAARNLLARSGYGTKEIESTVHGVLNTYRPSVVVLHDFGGEYGHGMHRYSAKAVADAVANASATDFVPSKIYSHLFAQNEIVLPIDEPLPSRGQKSAFNVSQEAFQFHKSQHWTWFYDWLYGNQTKITAARQIRTYNPAHYGLYLTLVGEDSGNDMLENVETVAQRKEREEAQAKALAAVTVTEEVTSATEIAAAEVSEITEATAEVTAPTFIYNEENEPVAKEVEGIGMRYLIFPIIAVLIILGILITVWIIEEKPFINIDFSEGESK